MATGLFTFNIFAYLVEFELEIIRERTKAGLEAAKARGRSGGRPGGFFLSGYGKSKVGKTAL